MFEALLLEGGKEPTYALDELPPLVYAPSVAILATLGMTSPSTVTPVSGGWDTTIWRVEHGRATYALRVFRAEIGAVVEDRDRPLGRFGVGDRGAHDRAEELLAEALLQ